MVNLWQLTKAESAQEAIIESERFGFGDFDGLEIRMRRVEQEIRFVADDDARDLQHRGTLLAGPEISKGFCARGRRFRLPVARQACRGQSFHHAMSELN